MDEWTAIEAVHLRCDHDVDATYEIAVGVLGVGEDYGLFGSQRGVRVASRSQLGWPA
jgi:hypothetical protein